jgi:hypothetical protein
MVSKERWKMKEIEIVLRADISDPMIYDSALLINEITSNLKYFTDKLVNIQIKKIEFLENKNENTSTV